METLNQVESFLVQTEELQFCPNCQSSDRQLWCKSHDRLNRLNQQRFIYSQCQNCNLIFLSLRPLEAEIYKFYPETYQPYQGKQHQKSSKDLKLSPSNVLASEQFLKRISKKIFNIIRSDPFKKEFAKFYQPSETGLRLLDFGCGSEKFLNSARELGWDTLGIDFSQQSVEQVRAHNHQALLMSPTVWDEIENESLDFVRMNHVFEHLYHPQEILQAIYSKMKPGATLHIGVPNPYSITSRMFRSRWWGLECPRHIMLYSPKLLKNLLVETEFSQVKIIHETVTKDFLRSWGYRLHDQGSISYEEVGKMIQKRYLSTLLYPVARLASTFGVADRFHVFCKK
jgi:2-polyprenyl-3-methyl-5-hydroxy-6-metoxy-1,4-benzoquinol methylase